MSSFKDEVKNFFTRETEKIIDDDLRFKNKLNLGEDAYAYLKTAHNLKDFLEVIAIGGCAAGGSYAAWLASLGFFAKLGLAMGIVSTPVGWVAGAGALGALAGVGVKKFFRKARQKSMIEIPKFISRPLDILAECIAELLIPIGVKMALSDGEFAASERKALEDYFHDEWGFNRYYIGERINKITSDIDKYDYSQLKQDLKQIAKNNKELKYNVMVDEILNIARMIVHADGVLQNKESQELYKLESILKN